MKDTIIALLVAGTVAIIGGLIALPFMKVKEPIVVHDTLNYAPAPEHVYFRDLQTGRCVDLHVGPKLSVTLTYADAQRCQPSEVPRGTQR